MPAHTPLITHLLDCDFTTFVSGEQYWMEHLHHFHQLDVVLDGEVRVGLNRDTPIQAGRGHILLLPPLCLHSYFTRDGFRQASFKFHLAPAHWARFGNQPLRAQLEPHLLQNLEDAGRRYLANAPLRDQQCVAAATLCLMAMLDAHPHVGAAEPVDNPLHPKLWTLLEEIENAPYSDWSVAGLAQRCHLSPDHFSRCFYRLLQRTPQRYLLEARMRAAAKDLLSEPPMPIKHIAECCGYASVHAFSRAFHSVFHCGPAAYRRAPRDL